MKTFIKNLKYYSEVPRNFTVEVYNFNKDCMEESNILGKILFGTIFPFILIFIAVIGYGIILPITALCSKAM